MRDCFATLDARSVLHDEKFRSERSPALQTFRRLAEDAGLSGERGFTDHRSVEPRVRGLAEAPSS